MKFYPVSYTVVGFVDVNIFIGICHVLFDLRWEVIVCFVDVDIFIGICHVLFDLRWEVIVCFVDVDIFIGICHVLFDLRWEVIVCFVDIGDRVYVDNHCFSSLFITRINSRPCNTEWFFFCLLCLPNRANQLHITCGK
jgi:hypothetical protein